MNFDNQKKVLQHLIDLEFNKNMILYGFFIFIGAGLCYLLFLTQLGIFLLAGLVVLAFYIIVKGFNLFIRHLKIKDLKQMIGNAENLEELNTVKKMFNVGI
ncbi:MAG: hypothetical protein PHI40_07545 [Caldisericia bacterium]|nr:hypothetical protein [Caldisericia bacterium]